MSPRGSGAPPDAHPVIVHPHCHGRATVGVASDQEALRRLHQQPKSPPWFRRSPLLLLLLLSPQFLATTRRSS